MPMGRPAGSRVVTTLTPVAKLPSSWRNRAGSTPGILSPEELGEDARSEHTTRGHSVAGRAADKIREVGAPRQATHDMIGERRRAHAHGDQPFEQPLSEECSPSCLRVGLQRRRWKGHTDPARQRGDDALRRELGPSKRRVDPLSRERIEEVGGITYEYRATSRSDGRARPLCERPRDEYFAY